MHVRTTIAISLIVLVSVFSNVRLNHPTDRLLLKLTGIDEIRPDERALYIKRFEGLRKMLPPHGFVGYIGNRDPVLGSADKFFLTQHALAPVILDNASDHQFIVGNFDDSSAGLKVSGERRLTLVKDFGNGVLLFQRDR